MSEQSRDPSATQVLTRLGFDFVCEVPPGSRMIAWQDGVVVVHPEHPPVFVNKHGTRAVRFDLATDLPVLL